MGLSVMKGYSAWHFTETSLPAPTTAFTSTVRRERAGTAYDSSWVVPSRNMKVTTTSRGAFTGCPRHRYSWKPAPV